MTWTQIGTVITYAVGSVAMAYVLWQMFIAGPQRRRAQRDDHAANRQRFRQ